MPGVARRQWARVTTVETFLSRGEKETEEQLLLRTDRAEGSSTELGDCVYYSLGQTFQLLTLYGSYYTAAWWKWLTVLIPKYPSETWSDLISMSLPQLPYPLKL